jgi:Protein of unknown function (DUF2380)
MLHTILQEKLGVSRRFSFVAAPLELQKRGYRRPRSNLILNINLYMEDVQSGKIEFARSVDIRGNTEESWRRGLDYMLRHYVLDEP